MFRALLLIGAAFALLAGCVEFGGDRGVDLARVRVDLRDGRYRVVKSHVRGRAECETLMYINLDPAVFFNTGTSEPGGVGIWIGGDAALRERAWAALHEEAQLQGPQVFINVREEFDTSGFLFFYKVVSMTVTADVIKFTDE